ncbi:acetyl-CoA carboxylase carboxyl transferase subunit beta [Acetitomaculum ruminis DSM 5522]|uniref:Acetyl-coenzyme A carboxylase carboxyl transferase subunit beta n=1 Tax=Acetitomaculum ruminis DSM 5522 TaxID=1120918 RepID=A0A1I0ZNA1_9FIRM|nr:acetyl-CoA carboxylase carboxyltransferase subunit beta [Acetitomaculum ruminis]SFB26977.1 acetyl-CoA carboxylase carboxyl transferase subunit beta [Acetitomaculum ruminis DSM 5522]
MELKNFFIKANNELENSEKKVKSRTITCKKCQKKISVSKIRDGNYVCPKCGHYFPIRARRRILMLTDKKSFVEMDKDLESINILNFPEYEEKLEASKIKSREKEGVICGVATINGHRLCIFSMDGNFMMGSMGAIVGEKITRLFEYATRKHLPVLGITVSGGARMQEGMISLLQMSKVSGAVKAHGNDGNLYIVLLTNPTTGGVDASFAMLGDITLAEPKARVGFAGPRVIEKSLNQSLPENFQLADRVLECGFIDAIVSRKNQKEYIGKILKIHENNGGF